GSFKPRICRQWLADPLKEKEGRIILVASLGDLFHRDIPEEYIHEVLQVPHLASWHDYFLLTKRPRRMREVLARYQGWPIPNVSIGTSAENQKWLDVRAEQLVQIPVHHTAVRFLSCEPMLGPISIAQHVSKIGWVIFGEERAAHPRPADEKWFQHLKGECIEHDIPYHHHRSQNGEDVEYPFVDQRDRMVEHAVGLSSVIARAMDQRRRARRI
ncbi:MAG: DUF5131 family protein, partial [Planctomycetota bacterium]